MIASQTNPWLVVAWFTVGVVCLLALLVWESRQESPDYDFCFFAGVFIVPGWPVFLFILLVVLPLFGALVWLAKKLA